MKRGLVLGGGGLVGMAYHAGALKAFEERGARLAESDVTVGTSAGSVMASYMAAGWSSSDFYDYAHGSHPDAERDDAGQRAEVGRLFNPLWHTGGERLRRGIGSLFAVAAARGYWRTGGRLPGANLRKAFPSGLYSTADTRERFERDLPREWPRDGLFICAVDLYTGERVPFGRKGAPPATLPEAVLASTAIPGLFPPVPVGGRQYVDGGIASATSLDLAVAEGCDSILCIAPLGYRIDEATLSRDPRMWPSIALRSMFARALKREVSEARAAGVDVLVVRPWLTELKAHGANAMRHFNRIELVESAREGTHRLLDEYPDHPVMQRLQPKTADRRGA